MKVELWAPPYGDDLMVVNAARVSFGKRSEWLLMVGDQVVDGPHYERKVLSDRDTKLIQFLARGMTTFDFEEFVREVEDATFEGEYVGSYEKLIDLLWQWRRQPTHFAPFAHPQVSFHIKAPIFVARQLAKHQVGMVWSEVSRRYVDDEPEFYTPDVWRKRADNVKQGSSDEAVVWDDPSFFEDHCAHMKKLYKNMIEHGCCPEQARIVLPQSTMTEWIWTGSLYAWANVYNQRKPGGHAQRETQHIASEIHWHMHKYFPVSWEALTQ